MFCYRWSLSSVFVVAALHGFCVAAQDANCTRALGDVEVRGDLNIAARCQLTGTEVRGNVTLFSGGSLVARDVRIRGNLEATRADFVAIEGSRIDGNVELDELVGDASSIESSDLRGNVTLTGNRSALELLNNDIDGNVRASGNTGGLTISGNSIDGNLECSGNTPAPVGVGNRVRRASRDQCRNLQPPGSSPPPAGSDPPPATPPPTGGNPGTRDTTPPTLTLRGAQSVSLTINSPYADAGATATDSTDGDLTPLIVVENPVNTALLGTFTITYSVSDRSGNAAAPVTRTVTVQPLPAAGGGGGGATGVEIILALLLLAGWRARSNRVVRNYV